ncbi:NAD(P)H-dependent oxidoreductase [Pseudoflavitalea sp. G-6-1-2]|uniref:NADPH-dependent FMN reductase n=1 Tax=Pseudoflavitalea sp. G-6-1-2 TaxID=2728841 RepID=UPI00146F53B8|nr:NAD(P)H-dependent oxidoreductase [Pseudoflavitalea sp. G-6-1-2]NML21176.1 NAD(P)H-dependent oxidoreductase [Pseudoflavitalea sp. G-6-1-2]
MSNKKQVLAIIGSASANSSNERLMEHVANLLKPSIHTTIFNSLKSLPHFDPELSIGNPPQQIIEFREQIEKADAVIICTPEYVFSIPSGLKNAIEWCIATTVFSDKPCGLITASADGRKGHEELQLILQTAMASFTPATTLLIQGVKGKINSQGEITHEATLDALADFSKAFASLINQTN